MLIVVVCDCLLLFVVGCCVCVYCFLLLLCGVRCRRLLVGCLFLFRVLLVFFVVDVGRCVSMIVDCCVLLVMCCLLLVGCCLLFDC